MLMTPSELLATSIAQLQTLSDFLYDQLGEVASESSVQYGSMEVGACTQILVSLSVLIAELQAARTIPLDVVLGGATRLPQVRNLRDVEVGRLPGSPLNVK